MDGNTGFVLTGKHISISNYMRSNKIGEFIQNSENYKGLSYVTSREQREE